MAVKKKWGPLKTGCFGILAILGVFLLWLCYAIYWSYTAVPGSGNEAALRIDQLIADNQPKDADGAPGSKAVLDTIELYKKEEAAFKADHPARQTQSGLFSQPKDAIEFETFGQTGAPDADTERARLFLNRLEKSGLPAALNSVAAHSAFARPIVERAKSEHLLDILLPDQKPLRSLARYSSARMHVAAKEGDEQELIASFDATLGLARSTASEPLLISRVVAFSMVNMAVSELRTTLIERQLSAETLDALVASLERQSKWPPITFAIEGERQLMHDGIQKSFTDNGNGDGRFIPSGTSMFAGDGFFGNHVTGVAAKFRKVQNIVGFVVAGKKSTLTLADELFDEYVIFAQQSAVARRASGREARYPTGMEFRRYPIISILLPITQQAVVLQAAHDSNLTGTRLMLAIEQFRAKRGMYPTSLDQLVPEFLAAVPTDPFTGTPYGYIEHARPDEFGRSYLLYSYGNNFVDDGGAFEEKSNFLAENRGVKSQKLDWVVNAPRKTYQPPE